MNRSLPVPHTGGITYEFLSTASARVVEVASRIVTENRKKRAGKKKCKVLPMGGYFTLMSLKGVPLHHEVIGHPSLRSLERRSEQSLQVCTEALKHAKRRGKKTTTKVSKYRLVTGQSAAALRNGKYCLSLSGLPPDWSAAALLVILAKLVRRKTKKKKWATEIASQNNQPSLEHHIAMLMDAVV